MPDEITQQPATEWRIAQHRIRNDLQTLAALLRLSRRRVSDHALLDEYSEWLNALAALYDALPLWDSRDEVALEAIVTALRGRCQLSRSVGIAQASTVSVTAGAGLAATLGILGLLTYSCRNAAPGDTVTVNLSGDEAMARIETVFRPATKPDGGSVSPPVDKPAGELPGWPPLSLSLAAEALDGRFATGQDGDDIVAVLAFPHR